MSFPMGLFGHREFLAFRLPDVESSVYPQDRYKTSSSNAGLPTLPSSWSSSQAATPEDESLPSRPLRIWSFAEPAKIAVYQLKEASIFSLYLLLL